VYRFPDSTLDRSSVRGRALGYITEAVLRDRNHPSLAVVSVGNELSARPRSGTRRYVREAARRVRQLAHGVLVGLDVKASAPSARAVSLYRGSLQALGFTDYFGWYYGAARDLGPFLDRAHRLFPRLALLVSEFGAEANRAGPASQKGTYSFQSRLLRSHVSQVARRRFMSGAAIWILRDFRVRPGWHGGNPRPSPPFNHKGLVSYQGQYKPAFRAYRLAIRAARRRR
jgi:beta-glucuronidase